MKKPLLLSALLLSTAAGAASAPECAPDNGGIQLPDGFCAVVVADDLGRARHLTVRDNGDLFVALRETKNGGGIVALRDSDGDGRADVERRFADQGGTGIRLRNGFLYFGTPAAILRYPLAAHALEPSGPPQTVAEGFPEQRQHSTKSFAFDGADGLYVNVGAPSNACQQQTRTPGSPGQDPCPQLIRQAGVWRFAADATGQTQTGDGRRYATGIRNAVAIAWNPQAGALFVVQHGRDQLHELWPQRFTVEQNAELPAEELLRVGENTDGGWPYCYHDGRQNKKVLAPEYGGDGDEVGRCADALHPLLAFPAHWAPNDLLFYRGGQFPERYRHGAFIAFHGSWNRAPLEQQGYNVVFAPFKDGQPAGDWEVFAQGFAGGKVIEDSDDARFRPTGLAQGPD
nr:PQQ-dependent sugar dehydrogenase [Pseudomonadota bacterium]